MLSALVLATSCLNSDDENNYTYYNDTAITAFSLGTLNRYYTGKAKYKKAADGVTLADSTYKTTVTGSKYEFNIDHEGCKIYNNDSLPVGTDAKHVICSVSSKNSGVIIIRYKDSAGADSLAYYSSSDSIDFSEPRYFRVYANDGSGYREYTVNVNVHAEEADTFKWSKVATVSDFVGIDTMRLLELGRQMIAFCAKNGKTNVYAADAADGTDWTNTAMFDSNDAVANAVVFDDKLYTVNNKKLKSSVDGARWTDVADFDKKLLAGAGAGRLYALDDTSLYSSTDNGQSWTQETIDEDSKALLPTKNVSIAALPLSTNSNAYQLVMTGLITHGTDKKDTTTVVWGKTIETQSGSNAQSWVRYESDGGYKLPAMTNVAMTQYGSVLIATGGSPLNGATANGLTYLYVSEDNGLTWHTDTDYTCPKLSTDGSDVFGFAAGQDVDYSNRVAKGDTPVVKDNMLWIISGGTGEVWRGRLNRLGWTKYQTTFTE